MQCPSCGHKQRQHLECERCGIIFEKYKQRQERLAAEKEALKEQVHITVERGGGGFSGILAGIGIGVIIAAGVFFFLNTGKQGPAAPKLTAAQSLVEDDEELTTTQDRQETIQRIIPSPLNTPEDEALEGLAKQLAEDFPANTPLEKARNATVYIKTSWGSGSGFFVSKNGMIITNRHVLQMRSKDLEALNQKLQNGEKLLARERGNIRYLKKEMPLIRDRKMRKQVKDEIREREKVYRRYEKKQQEFRERIREIESSSPTNDAEVILVDGSSYPVDSIMMSDRYDLALISINAYGSPYLVARKGQEPQGEKVFTVGNPQGLRHTITSGIVSGYREYNNTSLIQTDAPINPGNSGGPLINSSGKALGVNTMILRDTEGIGFAIPMKLVFEEFGNYFSQD